MVTRGVSSKLEPVQGFAASGLDAGPKNTRRFSTPRLLSQRSGNSRQRCIRNTASASLKPLREKFAANSSVIAVRSVRWLHTGRFTPSHGGRRSHHSDMGYAASNVPLLDALKKETDAAKLWNTLATGKRKMRTSRCHGWRAGPGSRSQDGEDETETRDEERPRYRQNHGRRFACDRVTRIARYRRFA